MEAQAVTRRRVRCSAWLGDFECIQKFFYSCFDTRSILFEFCKVNSGETNDAGLKHPLEPVMRPATEENTFEPRRRNDSFFQVPGK